MKRCIPSKKGTARIAWARKTLSEHPVSRIESAEIQFRIPFASFEDTRRTQVSRRFMR